MWFNVPHSPGGDGEAGHAGAQEDVSGRAPLAQRGGRRAAGSGGRGGAAHSAAAAAAAAAAAHPAAAALPAAAAAAGALAARAPGNLLLLELNKPKLIYGYHNYYVVTCNL